MLAFLLPLALNVRRIVRIIFGWAAKHHVHVAFIALAAVAAYMALSNASLRGDIMHRDKIIALRDAVIDDMIVSSKKARVAQIALNKAATDKQTQIAKLTDENETNRFKLLARATVYAGRMRAKDYCERRTDTATEIGVAESGYKPSDDAVILARADLNILNANTARLSDIKAWGDALIDEGLAISVK